MFVTSRTNIYFFWKNEVRLSKKWLSQFLFFSKRSVKMTLNGLETTTCCKTNLFYLCFLSSYFLICTFSILRFILEQTCYGTTVVHFIMKSKTTKRKAHIEKSEVKEGTHRSTWLERPFDPPLVLHPLGIRTVVRNF